MTRLKAKEIERTSKDERDKKLKELKLELIKARADAAKGGTSKIREVKRTIAKILTLNKPRKKKLGKTK